MKTIALFVLFLSFLFADFSLSYRLDNSIVQKVKFKDKNHVLFVIEDNGELSEKLIILNDKKYIAFYQDGIEHIYEISDELSEPADNNSPQKPTSYKLLKKLDTNITVAGFKAQKWKIQYSDTGEIADVVVSNDSSISNAMHNVMQALRKILPADKQEQASMFDMGNGYVLLETGELKLTSYNENALSNKQFALYDSNFNSDSQNYSAEIERCFTDVCCGEKTQESKELSLFINSKINDWNLIKSAKCNTDTNSKVNIISAIYSTAQNKHITVELTTGTVAPYGKIESLIQQGIKVEDKKTYEIDGFKAISGYLPEADSTIIDIMLPNSTISIFKKGKGDLNNFAQKVIKLEHNKYISNAI